MPAFTYIRRYDSPAYWLVCCLLASLTIAFGFASVRNPIFGVFAALFATATIAVFRSIRRGDTSGLIVDDKTLRWWPSRRGEADNAIDLSLIRKVDWQHFDEERITFTTSDGRQVKLDHQFFGSGDEVLRAIAFRTQNVLLLDNGGLWYGSATYNAARTIDPRNRYSPPGFIMTSNAGESGEPPDARESPS